MSYSDLHLGIEVRERLDGCAAETLDAMRRAIFLASQNSALISQARRVADMQGMNAEDRFTFLAYHALVALEEYFQRTLRMNSLYPTPPLVIPAMQEQHKHVGHLNLDRGETCTLCGKDMHDPIHSTEPAPPTDQERIGNALQTIQQYGGIEGDHHRAWVIDQVVRHLVPNYQAWVVEQKGGEDGPNTYGWDEGIPP
jgi:hypothetical protein